MYTNGAIQHLFNGLQILIDKYNIIKFIIYIQKRFVLCVDI